MSKDQLHLMLAGQAGQEEPDWEVRELRRQLWRAPELIRLTNPPPRGTQKGDIYSFGLVLYQVVSRRGPWSQCTLSDKGVHNIPYHNHIAIK